MNNLVAGMYCLLFAGVWRMVYELANQSTTGPPPAVPMAPQTYKSADQPWLRAEWAAKAVRKYAEAQDRKWRHWNEAMFER
jgi:hypothetical protein